MKVVVSNKGQITIPKPVRDRLEITAGTILDVESIEGKMVAVKIQTQDVYSKWRGKGILPGGETVDDYLKRIRG